MKRFSLASVASTAMALPLAASAAVISWDSDHSHYLGLSDSYTGLLTQADGCSPNDRCAMTQTWDLGGGLSVTAQAYNSNDDSPNVLWHDAQPGRGGLGSEPSPLSARHEDNNTGEESIRLTFSSAVYRNQAMFNGDHAPLPDDVFSIENENGPVLTGSTNSGTLALGGVMVTDLFIEPGSDGINPWYLAGVDYTNISVPEPATLLLLTAGIAGLSLARRKNC